MAAWRVEGAALRPWESAVTEDGVRTLTSAAAVRSPEMRAKTRLMALGAWNSSMILMRAVPTW